MTLLAALAAFAQDPAPTANPLEDQDFSEVVLVWPDKFARWQKTRWWVGMELLFPPGLPLDAEENKGFNSIALQTKAIIACDQNAELGRKAIEVMCEIEDIALQATSIRRFKKESDRQLVQDVLDDLDAGLTGAQIQLQTNERGAITNVGLEGLDTRNTRLRMREEAMRQILARLVYPFHMKLQKDGVREGQWVEYDSDLMSMPSRFASQGHSMIVHYLNFYKGYLLVQDIGTGMVQIDGMVQQAVGRDGQTQGPQRATAAIDRDAEEGASSTDVTFNPTDPNRANMLAGPISWKLHMDGVSIYNVDNGVMEERVWSIRGRPNAANPGNLHLWYAGKIRLLGESDHPDLGPTGQIGYPGFPIEGLPPWLPVDPQMAEGLQVPLPMPSRPKDEKKKKDKK